MQQCQDFQYAIRSSLDSQLIDNAVFLAEQLYHMAPSDERAVLLAECYLRQHQPVRSRGVLQSVKSDRGRYLLALSHFQLRQYLDAELVLAPRDSSSPDSVVGGAAGLYLLGRVLRIRGATEKAIVMFTKSLTLCPHLWCAYQEICELGLGVSFFLFLCFSLLSRTLCRRIDVGNFEFNIQQERTICRPKPASTAARRHRKLRNRQRFTDLAALPTTTTSISTTSSSNN